MARDPFTYAACRADDVDPRWWDVDAPVAERKQAAATCAGCPAFEACWLARRQLGPVASGTWAGVYYPWTYRRASDETLAAFTAVFGEMFDSRGSSTPDNPFQLALFEEVL